MNNDLISRKELRKAFKKLPFFTGAYLYYARQLIDNAPTIEINTNDIQYAYDQGFKSGYELGKEERPHGKWLFKEVTDDHKVYGQCSVCKLRKRIDNYCPYCGAKMDEKEAEP